MLHQLGSIPSKFTRINLFYNQMMKSLLLSFGLLILISCGKKSEVIRSVSPEGTASIEISGEKLWADPWNCTIVAEKKGMQRVPAQVEIYRNDLTEEQVKVVWQSEQFASVSFNQGDEPPVIYLVRLSEQAISIGK